MKIFLYNKQNTTLISTLIVHYLERYNKAKLIYTIYYTIYTIYNIYTYNIYTIQYML